MAKTASNMIELGTKAIDFTLKDTVSEKNFSLQNLNSPIANVIMFICNHCPYVHHINEALVSLSNEYIKKGIRFIGISSNDAAQYPQDGPEKMKEWAKMIGYPFPYLYDETQEVAKAFKAACTPDFYVFNGELELAYRGQFDDSRPSNDTVCDGQHLRQALDNLLNKEPITFQQKPSLGCNIKWK
jgi:peroxiredoxin